MGVNDTKQQEKAPKKMITKKPAKGQGGASRSVRQVSRVRQRVAAFNKSRAGVATAKAVGTLAKGKEVLLSPKFIKSNLVAAACFAPLDPEHTKGLLELDGLAWGETIATVATLPLALGDFARNFVANPVYTVENSILTPAVELAKESDSLVESYKDGLNYLGTDLAVKCKSAFFVFKSACSHLVGFDYSGPTGAYMDKDGITTIWYEDHGRQFYVRTNTSLTQKGEILELCEKDEQGNVVRFLPKTKELFVTDAKTGNVSYYNDSEKMGIEFNKDGSQVESFYSPEGKLIGEFRYDSQKRLISEMSVNSDNETVCYDYYPDVLVDRTDENGNPIKALQLSSVKVVTKNADGTTTVSGARYDKKGELLSESTDIYKDGKLVKSSKNDWEHGEIVDQTEEDGVRVVTIYDMPTYDGEEVSAKSQTRILKNKDGSMMDETDIYENGKRVISYSCKTDSSGQIVSVDRIFWKKNEKESVVLRKDGKMETIRTDLGTGKVISRKIQDSRTQPISMQNQEGKPTGSLKQRIAQASQGSPQDPLVSRSNSAVRTV